MDSSSTVSAELGLRLVVPQQTIVPLVASLYYSKEDPYAIRIAFHVGLDEPVEWIFARELLSSGIEGREGLGDVVVWPSAGSADGTGGSVLNMELSSPFGQAHFEAPIKEISDFLKRTYAVVPAGDETDFVDVETELAELLRKHPAKLPGPGPRNGPGDYPQRKPSATTPSDRSLSRPIRFSQPRGLLSCPR
jgi:hypothetical protein